MNIKLRPITPADFGTIERWSRDEEFCLATGWTLNLTQMQIERSWHRILGEIGEDFLRLGIEVDGALVGYADFANVEHQVGRAEFGIAIGERALWGRGIGFAAGRAMLEHGFSHLGLTKITAQVHAPNLRSLALMRRLGFRQEGVLRRHDLYRGGLADVVLFGLLREEFEGF